MAKHGDVWRSPCGMMELRCGDYRDVLADVERVDAVITDPPYSERTHAGSDAAADRASDKAYRRDLGYRAWDGVAVAAFVAGWAPRVGGWFCAMTDDVIGQTWRAAYEAAGRYAFATVPVLQHRVRLSGDGPGSGCVHMMVSRPSSAAFMGWGSLPCWYESVPERGADVMGAKPLGLMRAIVRDYSRPGDLVCDPCAGWGNGLLAAAKLGRLAVGAEMDNDAYQVASRRLRGDEAKPRASQPSLFEAGR
jgi:site-specific DNA-methyltransferase (adenine-specific)